MRLQASPARAAIVAAELRHTQGIVVDTAFRRLSQRLGLTREEDPVKIERDLQRSSRGPRLERFPHLVIWHGRRVRARRPLCEACVIESLCPSSRSSDRPLATPLAASIHG